MLLSVEEISTFSVHPMLPVPKWSFFLSWPDAKSSSAHSPGLMDNSLKECSYLRERVNKVRRAHCCTFWSHAAFTWVDKALMKHLGFKSSNATLSIYRSDSSSASLFSCSVQVKESFKGFGDPALPASQVTSNPELVSANLQAEINQLTTIVLKLQDVFRFISFRVVASYFTCLGSAVSWVGLPNICRISLLCQSAEISHSIKKILFKSFNE